MHEHLSKTKDRYHNTPELDLSDRVGPALDGYANTGGRWEAGLHTFRGELEKGARIDDALSAALHAASEEAESSPEDAARRFWRQFPVEKAIESALDGYAPTGYIWLEAKKAFTERMEADVNIQNALQRALVVAAKGAESTMQEAAQRFWSTLQPSYQGEGVLSPDDQIGDGVFVRRVIHRPEGKHENAATFVGEKDGRPLVIKHGLPGVISREHAILSAVDHPAFPKVISYREAEPALGGLGRLAMERLPGQSLDAMLGITNQWENTPLDTTMAMKITKGIAEALTALVKAGYIYRDLNLGHILVDKSNNDIRVGLVDVESSAPIDTQSGKAKPEDIRGTWETMSPEEFEGGPLSEASLVYSLGTALVQMVTGKSPFFRSFEPSIDVETARETIHQLHKQLVFLELDNPHLKNILEKALHPNPSKRFQTLEEFVKAL